MRTRAILLTLYSLLYPALLLAQQPQAQQGQAILPANAKHVNGIAPGYGPTAGTGIHYAVDYATGSSTCGIQEAIDAAAAASGGNVVAPAGTCNVTASIVLKTGLELEGLGQKTGSSAGTLITSSTVDIFTLPSAAVYHVSIHDLSATSLSGGGHVFNLTTAGISGPIHLYNLNLTQNNTGKGAVYSLNGQLAQVYMRYCSVHYVAANTVPAIYINGSPNFGNSSFENLFFFGPNSTSGTYAMWIENGSGTGAIPSIKLSNLAFEACASGCINLLSLWQASVTNIGIADVTKPGNPLIHVGKSATAGSPGSRNISFSSIFSINGTATYPDLSIDGDLLYYSKGGGYTVQDSHLTYFGSTNGTTIFPTMIDSFVSNYVGAIPLIVKDGAFPASIQANFQGPAAAITGTGSNQTLYTYTLPAGIVGIGRGVRITADVKHSTGTGRVAYVLYINGQVINYESLVDTGDLKFDAEIFPTGASTGVGTNYFYGCSVIPTQRYALAYSRGLAWSSDQTVNLIFSAAKTEAVTPLFWSVQIIQ
jgi:hypothetical protein